MSWAAYHEESMKLAQHAARAARGGDLASAQAEYVAAARKELRALQELGSDKPRTFGVTAVGAAVLFFRGKEFAEAEKVALEALKTPLLPDFAKTQLQEILESIDLEQKGERTLQFLFQQILEFMNKKKTMIRDWNLNFFERAIAGASFGLVISILKTIELILGLASK